MSSLGGSALVIYQEVSINKNGRGNVKQLFVI